MSDPEGRPTVAELMPSVPGRLFPVGRLDYGSEGLLLLTSDGQLAHKLLHPRFGVEKEYALKLKEPLDENQLDKLIRGVAEGNDALHLESIARLPSRSRHVWYSIVLKEGRNRQLRRMMMVVKAPRILRLKRVRVGPLLLGDLKVGHWRLLSPEENRVLRRATEVGASGGRSSGERSRGRSKGGERSRGRARDGDRSRGQAQDGERGRSRSKGGARSRGRARDGDRSRGRGGASKKSGRGSKPSRGSRFSSDGSGSRQRGSGGQRSSRSRRGR